MSNLLNGQVDVGDLVDRYKTLRGEIEQRLAEVHGASNAKQIKRLQKEIRAHGGFVTKALDAVDKRPRPEIGDTGQVVTFEYDDRGDYCDDFYEEGTIVDVNNDKIVIRVPAQLRVIPAHTVKATWSARCQEWGDDESYEYWSHYE